jgi:hypothetical protein
MSNILEHEERKPEDNLETLKKLLKGLLQKQQDEHFISLISIVLYSAKGNIKRLK